MGDIAEQLIEDEMFNGVDSTGQYIHRVDKQWAERGDAKRKDAVKGLRTLLRHKGVTNALQQTSLIVEFCALHNIKQQPTREWFDLMCVEVQKRFELFVQWVNKKLGLPNYGKRKKPRRK